jgi:LysM repeat protein
VGKRSLLSLFALTGCWGQTLPQASPPWQDTSLVFRWMRPDTTYPFYEGENDTLFLSAYLLRTYQKLAAGGKVRVLHIGDSHIQGDVQGREIRKKLYTLWGPGGRGYVFPYALAGTTSTYDYLSSGAGQWLYARSVHSSPVLPLGMTGIAIGTYDPLATWRVRWAPEYTPAAPPSAQVGLLTRTLKDIQHTLAYHDSAAPLTRTIPAGYQLTWHTLSKPVLFLEGRFSWEGSDSLGYAELHGLFLEDTGRVTYYTMGINGARLRDLPTLPLLKESLRLLQPDLVVIDLGTNDLYGLDGGLVGYKLALEAAIDTIRKAISEVDILVTTPMSFYRRMRPVPELKAASQIARWVAVQKQVALWDAASLLGDIKSWRLAGLAHPDMVHLLSPGYAHKGQLFARAFLHGYWKYLVGRLTNPQEEGRQVTLPDSLLVVRAIPPTPTLSQWSGTPASAASPQTYAPPKPTYLFHKVRPGETLSTIAQRYGVSVQAIQQENGLRGTFIRAGQTLRIPTASGGSKTKPAPSTSTKNPPSGTRSHIVRPGESLWSIAQQYRTTVEALRRLNNLSPSQAIHPGQKLRIP